MIKRIAIIGYGNIAAKHIPVFRDLGCDIVASCNRSEEKNQLAGTEAGIPEVFTDYHEMIRKVKPDALLVSVSFWGMYPVLKEIIPYGLPILTEKPSGTSLAEHMELAALAKKHNTPVTIGLNRRYYSVLNKAIEMAGGKEAITNVLVEWSEDPGHMIHNRKLQPDQIRRQIFGNTIHGLDLLVYLAGKPADPKIETLDLGEPFRWLMNISGKSEQGRLFNFNSSWDNPVPWRVVFYASGKRFLLAPLETCEVMINKEKIKIEPHEKDQEFKAGFYDQNKLFLDHPGHPSADLASANESMALADMLSQRFYV